MTTAAVNFRFQADNRLRQGTRAAARDLQGLSSAGSSAIVELNQALELGQKAAAALFAGLSALPSAVLELGARGDQIAKLAEGLGQTAEETQRTTRALELGGASAEGAAKSLEIYTRQIGDARRGTGEAVGALEALGLTAVELGRLPLSEQVGEIAGALEGVEDAGLRASVGADLFGRGSRELLNTLADGEAALQANIALVQRYGIVSNETAARSEALQDAVSLAGQSLTALKDSVLAPLVPVATQVATAFADLFVTIREDTAGAGEALQRTFRDVAAPALATFLQLALEVTDQIEPTFLRLEAGVQRLNIAFLAVTGRFRQATAATSELLGTQQDLANTLARLRLEEGRNAEIAGEFLDTLVTIPPAASGASRSVGDLATAQRLTAQETDKANGALAQQAALAEELAGKAAEFEAAQREAIEAQKSALEEQAKAAEGAAAKLAQVTTSAVDSTSQALIAQLEITAGVLDETAQETLGTLQGLIGEIQASITEGLTESSTAALETILAVAGAAIGAASQLVGGIAAERLSAAEEAAAREQELGQQVTAATTEQERERLRVQQQVQQARSRSEAEAARKAFALQKALAIGQAVIGASLAIIQSFAQLGPIAGAVAAIAVGITTGIQIAAIAAQQPPQVAHAGADVLGTNTRDERMIRAMVGERVVSADAVESAGGPETFDRLEAGLGGLGGPQVIVMQQDVDGAAVIDERVSLVAGARPGSEVGAGRPSLTRRPARWSIT